jgi:hypothetical protein
VYAWEKSEGRRFTVHEDDHERGTPGLGCGHVDRATNKANQKLFGLAAQRVVAMRDYVAQKAQAGSMDVDVPKLGGNHREVGVQVVKTNPDNPLTVTAIDSNNNEFFRFDATRYEASMKRLAAFVRQLGIEMSDEALLEAAGQQRDAILKLLAPGKPIIEVDLTGKEPSARIIGSVEAPEQSQTSSH